MLERKITTGNVGTLVQGGVDAALGAGGAVLGKAGGKLGTRLAKAINGKDSEAIAEASTATKLGARHRGSLEKQAKAAEHFEKQFEKPADVISHNSGEAVHRVQDNHSEQGK
ncbi:MAG: hypothetical protein ABSD44_15390 [Terracidiphilus sp.]